MSRLSIDIWRKRSSASRLPWKSSSSRRVLLIQNQTLLTDALCSLDRYRLHDTSRDVVLIYPPHSQTPPISLKTPSKHLRNQNTQTLTHLLDSGTRFVLRKKPDGQLLSPTAHAVEREYRVLHAIHQFNIKPSTSSEARVPIPEPIALCEDKSVIGTNFYIMEFLEGRIFENPALPEVKPSERRELYVVWDLV